MLIEQELLNSYKQYDYLNNKQGNSLVKILVSYIKPSFLFKSKILMPIHLGKAVEKENSKDGVQSDKNLKWLHENCDFNDDFEGGLSKYNRRIGFLTGTYWAWKNYEKLGNPEYFGSFGCRKLLLASALENLREYDFVLPQKENALPSIKQQLAAFHGENLFKAIEMGLKKFYPNEWDEANAYFNQPLGYCHELYILKKELFFEYCHWIFPLIQFWLSLELDFMKKDEIHKASQQYFSNRGEKRDIAFMVERVTGYWLYNLTKRNSKFKEVAVQKFISEEEQRKQKIDLLKAIRNNVKISNKGKGND